MYYLKHKRALTYIFCILFLASIALSGAYIVIESNHTCDGLNCSVCAHIQAAEKAIEQLGTGLFFVLLAGSATAVCCIILLLIISNTVFPTLITQNVRMNN